MGISNNYILGVIANYQRYADQSKDFERVNKELTLQGNIVISVGCFGHAGDVFTDE